MCRASPSEKMHRLVVLSFLSGKVDKIGKIGSSLCTDPWRRVNLRRHLKTQYKVILICMRMRPWSGLEIAGVGLKFMGRKSPGLNVAERENMLNLPRFSRL